METGAWEEAGELGAETGEETGEETGGAGLEDQPEAGQRGEAPLYSAGPGMG